MASFAVILLVGFRVEFVVAQTAGSNAGFEGGQDHLFDAVSATPNEMTAVPQDNIFATAPDLEQRAPVRPFTLNVLTPLLFNSNAQYSSSGGSKTLEGSPFVRLGWTSQLFDLPIRVSTTASAETERFVNAAGAAVDYVRASARAQYINPTDDQDYSPFLSYSSRRDFTPTFANNFGARHDVNIGLDKLFRFDNDFNRIPASPNSSATNVWSIGFSIGAQQRVRDPPPGSRALFFNPSVSYVMTENWNASLEMTIRGRWFEPIGEVSQRDLTWEPAGVVEYVIPADWLGGADEARCRGNPAIDFVTGFERNWSNISEREYSQWQVGLVFKTGWRF